MWSYSHLICAMSKSKLFPSSLSTPSKYGTPYKGILVGASISYVLSLGVDSCQVVNDIVYFVCMMSACLTYIAYCCAFFKMRTTFKSIPRSFHSPFGCAGAIFSISIWVLNFIVLGIMEHWILAPLFGSLTVFLSFLYYKFIKKQQIFSEEENEILLRVHIVNFNSKKDKNSKSNHTNKNSGGAKIIPINGPSSSIGASRHSHSSVPRYTELEKPITI
jgi:amino acid permease